MCVCVSVCFFSNLLNEKCWRIKCPSFVYDSNNCMRCESQRDGHGEERGKEAVTLQLLWFSGAHSTVLISSKE